MNPDFYIYAIVALLPLSACMVVFQVNPYHALVIRGILGAVAALVYAVLGAADVALTEALVGTMLAITLYAVAVRSSLILRIGVLKEGFIEAETEGPLKQLLDRFRSIFNRYHLRLELVPYLNLEELEQALLEKEIHATCVPPEQATGEETPAYHTATRIQRIYDILHSELSAPEAQLTYFPVTDSGEKH